MDYQLLVVRGRSESQALKLIDGVNTVGRQDDCQIRIKSSQVSRRHCELFEKKGLLLVKDLGSSNGTFVNGKKINVQQVLEPGDELTVGAVTLKVSKVGEAPPPSKTSGAGDTAVAAAVAAPSSAPVGADDEFEIDFDDDPSVEAVAEEPDFEVDFGPEPEPATAAAAEAAAEPAATPAPVAEAPAPPKTAPKEPESDQNQLADEAIADFLLDIKLDEDD